MRPSFTGVVSTILGLQCVVADAISQPAPSNVRSVSIAGVMLGMTPAQSQAALAKHNPAVKVRIVTVDSSTCCNWNHFPKVLVAQSSDVPAYSPDFDNVTVYFSMHPTPSRVTAIYRNVQWKEGQERAITAIVSSMEAAFGPAVAKPDPGASRDFYLWAWNANGDPYVLKDIVEPSGLIAHPGCFTAMSIGTERPGSEVGRPASMWDVPGGFTNNLLPRARVLCPQTSAAVMLKVDGTGELTRSMVLTAIAMKEEIAGIAATDEWRQQAKARADSLARVKAAGRVIKP